MLKVLVPGNIRECELCAATGAWTRANQLRVVKRSHVSIANCMPSILARTSPVRVQIVDVLFRKGRNRLSDICGANQT